MRGMLWFGALFEAYKMLFLGFIFFGLTLLVVFAYVEYKLIRERHKVEELRITKRRMIQDLERKLEELRAARDRDHQELVARIEALEAKLPKGT